jgi:hypothetical protein
MVTEELAGTEKEELIPDLDRVTAAAKHQLGLVNDILDRSKIEAGKMILFMEDFDAAKLIARLREQSGCWSPRMGTDWWWRRMASGGCELMKPSCGKSC